MPLAQLDNTLVLLKRLAKIALLDAIHVSLNHNAHHVLLAISSLAVNACHA